MYICKKLKNMEKEVLMFGSVTETELLEFGFVPDLDSKQNKISYPDEGFHYVLKKEGLEFSTSQYYPYLIVSVAGSVYYREIVTRKITKEKILKALEFKTKDDFMWLGDD